MSANPSDLARQLAALRRSAAFVCAVCGAEFQAVVRRGDGPRYCTTACRSKAWRQRRPRA